MQLASLKKEQNVGKINKTKNAYKLVIKGINNCSKVLNQLENYPLLTYKLVKVLILCYIFNLNLNKEHLTQCRVAEQQSSRAAEHKFMKLYRL